MHLKALSVSEEMHKRRIALTDVWENALVRTADCTPAGKMVVIPSLIDGLDIHQPSSLPKGFTMHILPHNLTYMIHARRHQVLT